METDKLLSKLFPLSAGLTKADYSSWALFQLDVAMFLSSGQSNVDKSY